MSALKKILSAKTDHELMFYVQNVDKHTEEAVRLALVRLCWQPIARMSENPDGRSYYLDYYIACLPFLYRNI